MSGRYKALFKVVYSSKKKKRYISMLNKCKNEVGCREDTVPKTVDTRRHCEEE